MRTQAPQFRQLVIPALFALLSVGLIIATWLAFGGRTPLQARDYEMSIPLKQASNLFPGSDVRMAGVHVGRVLAVDDTPTAAKVKLQVEARNAPLRTGARALLRTKTLLGEAYLEISSGPVDRPLLPEGGSLTSRSVDPQQRLDDVLSTFSPSTRANLRTLFKGIGRAFAEPAADSLNAALGSVPPVSTGLASLADSLAKQRLQVQQIFANGGEVLDALGRRQGALRAAISSASSVLDTTAKNDRALRAMIRSLPPFLDDVRATANTLSATSADLGPAVRALRPAAPEAKPALDAARTAAPQFERLFGELAPTLSVGSRKLPALDAVLRATDGALQRAYPLARQAIPFLQLLGLSRDSVIALFANVGSFFNISSIGAGGVPAKAIAGIPSIWNETPAGWVKKLPTNRQNAYPKPRSQLNIASGGLKAFDCRNTGNRLYLPATGTGSPPCAEQGPWEFGGVSRYFPHLEEAAP
jgi:phospholipid/cholesterol/gamma-HCH transport system substrate-binding protein